VWRSLTTPYRNASQITPRARLDLLGGYGPVTKAYYVVNYAKMGEGYIGFASIEVDGEWKLRDVKFALPASDTRSYARIEAVVNDLEN
jgi:hypothetical protein